MSQEIILEDAGYLAALPGQKTLILSDEKKQNTFELGVSMIIYKWDTLNIAVDSKWGGPESEGKRDWLTAIIIDAFKENNEIDIIYIHEMLFNAMEDEFGVIVEDESTVVIGQKVVEIYKECLEGNFDHVHRMYEDWRSKQERRHKTEVVIKEDELNPDVSDVEEVVPDLVDEMDVDDDRDDRRDQRPVDDDGFTLVIRKKKH
ncbi:hypothetical protein FOA43_001801 [Brettanomyces nanus]|uniref:Pre-rRNA-processing protein TSR2 n=1 Tax=Eeniella nana TaxID=13502 RepID=A0A875RY94_EENNA|nr:uncharacterized protein FOA43_001801 [Brettanomyces nanus]QPG74471.1 hypothetical protein FOA43_001801 [Brettanomyces nanus]